MADQPQDPASTPSPPQERNRQPSHPEMLAEREHYKEILARHVADAEERNASLVATLTGLSDDQRNLLATMRDASAADRAQQQELIAAIEEFTASVRASAGTPPAGDGTAQTGLATATAGEAAPQAASGTEITSPGDATTAPAEGDEGTDAETRNGAGAEGESESVAGRSAGGGEPAGEADQTAGEGAPDAESDEPEDASGNEGAAPDESGEETAAGDARFPSPAEIAAAIAETLPLGEIEARLETIRSALADRKEADADKAGQELQTVVDVLAALRNDFDAQSQLIQALHRSPPPGPGTAAGALPAAEAMKQHTEVMGHVDKLIIRVAGMLPGGPKEETTEGDAQSAGSARPPPTGLDDVRTAAADLSTQLRAESRSFRRFAWIGAATAIPMALALGIFVQHEYTLMPDPPPPDTTMGWKDLIWSAYGIEIADCLKREELGAGECIITITPPALSPGDG